MSRSPSRPTSRAQLKREPREYDLRVKLANAGGKYTQSSLALSEFIKLILSLLEESSWTLGGTHIRSGCGLHHVHQERRYGGERADAVLCARAATERLPLDGDLGANAGVGGGSIRRGRRASSSGISRFGRAASESVQFIGGKFMERTCD
ncbi:hypothetical protein FGB62_120g120 [Gracilaria domingensis]|nr:hypothetical protein FGB62_120g120 [Gracilaria domingensis]